MPDSYTQENRLISITTPLGTDKLLLAGFSGHEAISRLFTFHLDLLTPAQDPETLQAATPIDFAKIIGQQVTVSVNQSDGTPRYFNGIVSRFVRSGADAKFAHYQMDVVPWTWKLTRYADCKIFHKKSVKEIIDKVFQDRGCTDYRFSLLSTYDPLEYTVQYRETDFNFISRLMEQYGIFYFFEHEETKHTMVIADSSSVHQDCPGQAEAGFDLVSGGLHEDDVVHSWNVEGVWKSGKCTLTDYNFETPSTDLKASETTIESALVNGNDAFELFEYPCDYTTTSAGSAIAEVRMQEVETDHIIAHGSSACRAFTTGYKFSLKDHPLSAMNESYLLTEIQHMASVAGSYITAGTEGDAYSNQFTCIKSATPFRPARLTPKPFVQGPQPAVVVGKSQSNASGGGGSGSGEEIWVDKYGRVIVLFPWDRAKACSCWVRVSQEWAGQGWGSMVIPRVGQEVLVSFLEGDPDRPIITGRVYNADQTVPYALPGMQTRSTFMTRSSEGGSSSTYNELRFEDKKGEEQVFLRAQFDQDNRVLNDSREWIGKNRSLIVTKDQMELVKENHHSEVKQNSNQKIGQNLSLNVGQNLIEKSGQNFSHEAGVNIDLKGGVNVTIEAGVTLTLKAGSNFVMIGPSGVTIFGSLVMINSGGSASSASCGSPTAPTAPDQADDGSKGTKM
jgi:type VI secretion system secreted protein VgrG